MSETVLGVDLGTTTITALAWEPGSRKIVAQHTLANDAQITPPADRARGRSEWDPRQMAERACQCLRNVTEKLGARGKDVAALGITGQQHGVVLVDQDLQPLTPLVNWQDRRGDEPFPGGSRTFAAEARFLSGEDAFQRTGCGLATGFMGVTLFWWKVQGLLPACGTACFIGDYLASALTGRPPISDPTNAASSGLLDVGRRCWDGPLREALGLRAGLFPEIREADQIMGPLLPAAAVATGLPAGMPVFVAFGDSQAAFLGSVEDRQNEILINVGTGAQVIAAIDQFSYVSPLETRPLPGCGNLLVSAQLCGGRSYAVLEEFFRSVLGQLGRLDLPEKLYDVLNRLADGVPPGCDGLRCRPLFTGTRASPDQRASWTGVSPENFTPAHMARALLEGIAEVLHEDYERAVQAAGKSYRRLVGSGNALRKNPLLCRIIAQRFALPLRLLPYEEEAAVGAARMAALGAGIASLPRKSEMATLRSRQVAQ